MKADRRHLERLSADEMVSALGLETHVARVVAKRLLLRLSARLGRELATFDDDLARGSLAAAASSLLARLGVHYVAHGDALPPTGPLLVLANHPGAYDALALLAVLARSDVGAIARDRAFLDALPNLSSHLFKLRANRGGARTLLLARRHLARGGALLQFPRGAIEADPRFSPFEPVWDEGVRPLVEMARGSGAQVAVAVVSGVHSKLVKGSRIVQAFERRGATTFGPLIQTAFPRLAPRDVFVDVRLAKTDTREVVDLARSLGRLAAQRRVMAERKRSA